MSWPEFFDHSSVEVRCVEARPLAQRVHADAGESKTAAKIFLRHAAVPSVPDALQMGQQYSGSPQRIDLVQNVGHSQQELGSRFLGIEIRESQPVRNSAGAGSVA
jgi:hypothetical protein